MISLAYIMQIIINLLIINQDEKFKLVYLTIRKLTIIKFLINQKIFNFLKTIIYQQN